MLKCFALMVFHKISIFLFCWLNASTKALSAFISRVISFNALQTKNQFKFDVIIFYDLWPIKNTPKQSNEKSFVRFFVVVLLEALR